MFQIIDSIGTEFSVANNELIAFMDLDGTLTDGTVLYDGKRTSRRYFLQDGHAIGEAKRKGIFPIVLTSSPLTPDIKQRFSWLDIPIFCNLKRKSNFYFVWKHLFDEHTTAHIGDDLNDLEFMLHVDHKFIPSNANPQLGINLEKLGINYIKLQSSGGNGAVRDYLQTIIADCGL